MLLIPLHCKCLKTLVLTASALHTYVSAVEKYQASFKQWNYWGHLPLGKNLFLPGNIRKLIIQTVGNISYFLVLILAVNTVTSGLERVTDYICENDVQKC
jgi:hypothetical protein